MSKIHGKKMKHVGILYQYFCEVVNKFRASLKGQLGSSASIAFFSVIISDAIINMQPWGYVNSKNVKISNNFSSV